MSQCEPISDHCIWLYLILGLLFTWNAQLEKQAANEAEDISDNQKVEATCRWPENLPSAIGGSLSINKWEWSQS